MLRVFKQLEFLIVGQALRLPIVVPAPHCRAACAATERRGYSGRDPALEEKSRPLLRQLGAAKLARDVRVEWNPRMKSAAGRADYRERLISLNPLLHDHGVEEIDRTLRHELTHLLAQFRVGRRRIAPHGPEWREACRAPDIAAEAQS